MEDSPQVPPNNIMPPAHTQTAAKSVQTKYIVMGVIVVVVLLLIGSGVYILSMQKKAVQSGAAQTASATPTPTVPLKEEYSNPFDEESQYENPFQENPFDALSQ